MYVAFFRNLNLGHTGSPNREQLELALREAGAADVKSFQTNGTVLMKAPDPRRVVDQAIPSLARTSGYRDAVIVRPLADLQAVLDSGVFEKYSSTLTYRETFTFFEGGQSPTAELPWTTLPWTNQKNDVDVLYVCDGIVLSLVRKPRNTAGNPTKEVERATGGVATTRTRGSIARLLNAASAWT